MNEYRAEFLQSYRQFEPVYNDFKSKAVRQYKFELEPLNYNDFIDAIKKDLLKCLVVYENDSPVGFLIYTTQISEAIELNIIHAVDMKNFNNRCNCLIEKFLQETLELRKEKVVCYPLLGAQKTLLSSLAYSGFKFVGTAVLRFAMNDTDSIYALNSIQANELPKGYEIVPWKDFYFDDAVNIVNQAFKITADALFDPRFKSVEGTTDILEKITKNIYAQFLPDSTSVLIFDDEPVGFCFMNVTSDKYANIPIVAIEPSHQGKGLSRFLIKNSMDIVLDNIKQYRSSIVEISTTTETNNSKALKMYQNVGFKEDYTYPQAYLPVVTDSVVQETL